MTPLVKLPIEVQISLGLIREELKSRRFFKILQDAGLDDCYFQPHLDFLIIQSIDLDISDEAFHRYDSILEKRSNKIQADNDSIMKQAMKVYMELQNMKRQPANG